MTSEYVRFKRPEVTYSQKNLLQSEINLLKLARSYQEYKKLRKEEFALKVALKTKVEEAKNTLALIETLLPKTKSNPLLEKEMPEDKVVSRKKLSLEQEIELIRKKLEALK